MTVTALLLTCVTCTGLLAGPGGAPGEVSWRWPLPPVPTVVRAFDPPSRPWGPGHRGVDLAARPGQPVYAAGPGRVSYAGRLAGRGVISITHGRLRTTYLPVRPSVRPGRRVRPGDRIGVVENLPGHCARQSCLHWGLMILRPPYGPSYADPLSLLGAGRVRLLPVWNIPPPDPGGGRTSPPARTPAPAAPSLAGALASPGHPAVLLTVTAVLAALTITRGRNRRAVSARSGGGPGGRSA